MRDIVDGGTINAAPEIGDLLGGIHLAHVAEIMLTHETRGSITHALNVKAAHKLRR